MIVFKIKTQSVYKFIELMNFFTKKNVNIAFRGIISYHFNLFRAFDTYFAHSTSPMDEPSYKILIVIIINIHHFKEVSNQLLSQIFNKSLNNLANIPIYGVLTSLLPQYFIFKFLFEGQSWSKHRVFIYA